MSGMKVPQSEAALFIGSEKSAVGSLGPTQFFTVKKKKKKSKQQKYPSVKQVAYLFPELNKEALWRDESSLALDKKDG